MAEIMCLWLVLHRRRLTAGEELLTGSAISGQLRRKASWASWLLQEPHLCISSWRVLRADLGMVKGRGEDGLPVRYFQVCGRDVRRFDCMQQSEATREHSITSHRGLITRL